MEDDPITFSRGSISAEWSNGKLTIKPQGEGEVSAVSGPDFLQFVDWLLDCRAEMMKRR